MNMTCTFCAQGRAAPAFYGTRNLPPVSADHAVRKQGRACNPRLLILGDQLLRETSAPPQPGCIEARKQHSGIFDFLTNLNINTISGLRLANEKDFSNRPNRDHSAIIESWAAANGGLNGDKFGCLWVAGWKSGCR
jgi:hypothetical protein